MSRSDPTNDAAVTWCQINRPDLSEFTIATEPHQVPAKRAVIPLWVLVALFTRAQEASAEDR